MTKRQVKPRKVIISYLAQETQFQFRFEFRVADKLEPLELLISSEGAITMMKAIQELQVRHSIPIPDRLRQKARPRLVVVKVGE